MNRAITHRTVSTAAALLAVMFTVSLCKTADAYRREDREIDRISKALSALDAANDELVHASNDFHGHKAIAMQKTEEARHILEDSRDAHVDRAVDKIEDAIDELKICIKGDRDEDHPNIHQAIRALEAAKDQL